MTDRYRFDDAYGKVYKYDEDSDAYIFCGSYYAYGIDAQMPESKKLDIVSRDEE